MYCICTTPSPFDTIIISYLIHNVNKQKTNGNEKILTNTHICLMIYKEMKLAEPKILYNDIIINNNNIDDFLNTSHGGAYHYDTNTIILYNYTTLFSIFFFSFCIFSIKLRSVSQRDFILSRSSFNSLMTFVSVSIFCLSFSRFIASRSISS